MQRSSSVKKNRSHIKSVKVKTKTIPDSVTPDKTIPYLIGSNKFAGISKIVEEAGEVLQVIGKLMGFGKFGIHWDGKPVKGSLEDEIADLLAAVDFAISKNKLSRKKIEARRREKLKKFQFWHKNIQSGRDPRDGGK